MDATMTNDFVQCNGEWLGIMDSSVVFDNDKFLGYYDGTLGDGTFIDVADSEETGKIVAVYQTPAGRKFAVIEEV